MGGSVLSRRLRCIRRCVEIRSASPAARSRCQRRFGRPGCQHSAGEALRRRPAAAEQGGSPRKIVAKVQRPGRAMARVHGIRPSSWTRRHRLRLRLAFWDSASWWTVCCPAEMRKEMQKVSEPYLKSRMNSGSPRRFDSDPGHQNQARLRTAFKSPLVSRDTGAFFMAGQHVPPQPPVADQAPTRTLEGGGSVVFKEKNASPRRHSPAPGLAAPASR